MRSLWWIDAGRVSGGPLRHKAKSLELFDVNQFVVFGGLIALIYGSLRRESSAAILDLRGVYDACLCCDEGGIVS